MSVMMEYSSNPQAQDVGEILVKVQEDLRQLRDKLLTHGDRDDSGSLDLSALEKAISKTEHSIESKTEQVLQQLNNQVITLPSLHGAQKRNNDQVSMETMWDLGTSAKGSFALRQAKGSKTDLMDSRELGQNQSAFLRRLPEKRLGGQETQMAGPTPGQSFKHSHHMRVIGDAHNPRNREIVRDSYGIQLPLINQRRAVKPTQHITKGSTVEPLAKLPRANRLDPQLLPPPISEDDAKKGIMNLMERGLIPSAAELTLDPSPIKHQMALLHDPQEKEADRTQPGGPSLGFIKLDPNVQLTDRAGSPVLKSASSTENKVVAATAESSRKASGREGKGGLASDSQSRVSQSAKTSERIIDPLPPPTTPASTSLRDFPKDKSHRFAVQNGRTRESSHEFVAFKQHYCLSWGSIVTMLTYLEKFMSNYAVPVAFINGDKLADLSLEFELERQPTVRDFLPVIVNREDVERTIFKPGRRYMGNNGQRVAASKIQATYRMYRQRTEYLEFRRKKWAAGVIAISWVMCVKMSKVRKQLKATRLDQLEAFRERAKIFAKNWDRIKQSKRVIIHIPSLGYSQMLRSTLDDKFGRMQNTQMGRICDISDPNVDVIYVSPVAVNEELLQYYTKFMGLKTAIDSGSAADQSDLSSRYKIIVPDAIKSFPAHRMCLSTILKYSPKTLKRIKSLILGREAYVVTGVPHGDDIYLSDYLNVPVLSPEPEVAHLYTTKSGSKRVFASADVAVPPGEYDVYNLQQLHECLAQLITENLQVTRWLFKLDDEFGGRGIAYCDIAEHLPCYTWALKEAFRYGDKWNKKWAQEAAYLKIHAEIPEVLAYCAQPANTQVYPTWEKYLAAFLSQGGIIEACPPSESVTALTVNMLIEPDGRVSMAAVGDQIHAETPFACWGLSVPQSSVEPEQLNSVCAKVAEACKARGVVGYFAMDLVTFIHPKTMVQELWAVDLNLAYDDSLAMFRLMEFVAQGTLDTKTHLFDVPPPKREEKRQRRRLLALHPQREDPPSTTRYAVMSTNLRHTNLSVVHYSVFFQMCRAHGIGYDVKEKQGTVFTLIDGTARENLGMLTVGDNLQGTLATFARNLSVIHQEISAPNMQGSSNFKPVIEDIEGILGTTVQNAEDDVSDVSSVQGT